MVVHPINFAEKLTKLSELWSPRVIAELNDWGVVNTGDAGGTLTAPNDVWI
jgi:hypothetical protein